MARKASDRGSGAVFRPLELALEPGVDGRAHHAPWQAWLAWESAPRATQSSQNPPHEKCLRSFWSVPEIFLGQWLQNLAHFRGKLSQKSQL